MWIFFSTLRSGDHVKTSFTLGSATVSASGTYGGSDLTLLMVSAIFNSVFLVESPASN